MEKRYLINEEVYQGSEMPSVKNYNFSEDEEKFYKNDLIEWKQSLVKLDCNESELDKIKDSFKRWIFYNEIIDIKSITTRVFGSVYFKEVESESNVNSINIKFNSFEDKKPIDGEKIFVLDRWGLIGEATYQGDWQIDYWIKNGYKWTKNPVEFV